MYVSLIHSYVLSSQTELNSYSNIQCLYRRHHHQGMSGDSDVATYVFVNRICHSLLFVPYWGSSVWRTGGCVEDDRLHNVSTTSASTCGFN